MLRQNGFSVKGLRLYSSAYQLFAMLLCHPEWCMSKSGCMSIAFVDHRYDMFIVVVSPKLFLTTAKPGGIKLKHLLLRI